MIHKQVGGLVPGTGQNAELKKGLKHLIFKCRAIINHKRDQ